MSRSAMARWGDYPPHARRDTAITVYRLPNALPRVFLVLAGVMAVGLLIGAPAYADEPTPRAIPEARAYPLTFASYDALIAYATAVAADQNALDARLASVRTEGSALSTTLSVPTRATGRGKLFDPDARRDDRALIAAVSVRVSVLVAVDRQLVAAGALTSASAAWRMPTGGRITQPFGPTKLKVEPSRVYGGVSYAHFHEGVDIAGDWAADVVAPARGRVVFVGRMLDGAEVVVLAHDGGIVTLYAHLNASNAPPPVAAGDEVAAGQKIGTVGNTGISTGMHLHWGAWRNGELIDPITLFAH